MVRALSTRWTSGREEREENVDVEFTKRGRRCEWGIALW